MGHERTLEANAATLAFTGTMLGATADRRWLAVPAIVTVFLFQHAVQGWCPPVPLLRRLGFRTMREIDTERYALKALRGDLGPIGPGAGTGIPGRATPCRLRGYKQASRRPQWATREIRAFPSQRVPCSDWGWAGFSTGSSCTWCSSGITCPWNSRRSRAVRGSGTAPFAVGSARHTGRERLLMTLIE